MAKKRIHSPKASQKLGGGREGGRENELLQPKAEPKAAAWDHRALRGKASTSLRVLNHSGPPHIQTKRKLRWVLAVG